MIYWNEVKDNMFVIKLCIMLGLLKLIFYFLKIFCDFWMIIKLYRFEIKYINIFYNSEFLIIL